MKKFVISGAAVVFMLALAPVVWAGRPRPTPPPPPTPPTAPTPRPTPPPPPTPPPLPDLPEVSGIYSDPQAPGLLVQVFVDNHRLPRAQTAPVCTDPDSAAVTSSAEWKLPSSNWTYRLNPSSVPSSVGSANLATIVTNSVLTWEAPLGGTKPTLVAGANTTLARSRYDGQNIIAWGNTSRLALGVTYIWYYPSTGLAVDVDTIMNRRVRWSWGPVCGANSYDAADVMIHELGHWYGLDDEYDTPYLENTMYGYASLGEVKKTTLTSGDAAGIQAIYP